MVERSWESSRNLSQSWILPLICWAQVIHIVVHSFTCSFICSLIHFLPAPACFCHHRPYPQPQKIICGQVIWLLWAHFFIPGLFWGQRDKINESQCGLGWWHHVASLSDIHYQTWTWVSSVFTFAGKSKVETISRVRDVSGSWSLVNFVIKHWIWEMEPLKEPRSLGGWLGSLVHRWGILGCTMRLDGVWNSVCKVAEARRSKQVTAQSGGEATDECVSEWLGKGLTRWMNEWTMMWLNKRVDN